MRKSFYLKTASLFFLLGITASLSAQTKRWEHNIYEGVGFVNKFEYSDEQTIAFRIGYGINYYLTPNWSVMPGVALRLKALGKDNDNSGNCTSTYIDIPLLVQYHLGGEKRKGLVVECGPVLSFLAHGETYSGTGWVPWHPFEGEKMYKGFDVGIRPAVYYETENWRFGVQSHIGLLDIKCEYSTYSGRLGDPYHAFDLVATINYHW